MFFTKWRDISGEAFETVETTWPDFVAWVESLPAKATKSDCQLISFSVFGDNRASDGRGSLRHGANVVGCWGVELDYDGESMDWREAGRRLAEAEIEALVYTSPSHEDAAPRWRVIVPFDKMLTPDARLEAAERVNGILGGVLTSESFSLSQPFYVGPVIGRPWHVGAVAGRGVIGREDLPRLPKRHKIREGGRIERVSQSDLVDNILAGEEIHPSIRDLAWFYGWSQDDLEDLLHKSKLRTDRPDRYRTALKGDIPRAVASAVKKRHDELAAKLANVPAPPKPPLSPALFLSVGQMLSRVSPVRWHIKGLFERGSNVLFFGEPNIGKSFMSVDWGLCVATGTPWNGRPVEQGPVMYLAGEGVNGLSRRVLAWQMQHRVDASNSPIWFSQRGQSLTTNEGLEKLYAELAFLPVRPQLIFIDTLSRMFPGADQNSSKEMGQIVERLDAIREGYGCTLVTVHHSSKADPTQSKGAVEVRAACDTEIGLIKGDAGRVKLICPKQKDSAKFEDMHFEFVSHTLPYWEDGEPIRPNDVSNGREAQNSAVLVPWKPADGAEGVPGVKGPADKKDDAATLVREILRDAGPSGLGKAALIDEFAGLRDTKRSTSRTALDRALKSLTEAGIVVHNKDDDAYILPFG